MQCSRIHRSLGVHISKVRSATLDTQLPEQVASIQAMGNEKKNNYWEAVLPPNYDAVGIENFIRAKDEDKRWISWGGKPKSPTIGQEDKASMLWQRRGKRSGKGHIPSSENTFEERKNTWPPNFSLATRITVPIPPKGPEQVTPIPKPHHAKKIEPELVVPQDEAKKQRGKAASAVSPPKALLYFSLSFSLLEESVASSGPLLFQWFPWMNFEYRRVFGCLVDVREFFEKMTKRYVGTWKAMVLVYVQGVVPKLFEEWPPKGIFEPLIEEENTPLFFSL
ncbi:ADP-ribosylation factor GTPase-activating protein AGD5-like [Juglans microcarpa x Juglans regia]|uniref:ADP-ribosylation factor GTPase-activating protein AGD5-like n=1 Tax=Juglans microcarpa x Juglans regia TaxID=2249226 RepID=UPI001B7DF099|nr:ADP-ribosylation factor GTPase-activating protein AGD5-like [Juglans microcarpa x Juglans regia]